MNKKIITLILILTGIMMLSACKGKQQEVVEAPKSELDKIEMIKIDLIGAEEDATQNYWAMTIHNVAKGDGGYYYTDNNFIYYFDDSSEKSTLLCAKADCDHENNNCNAYIGEGIDKKMEVFYRIDTIYYYKGWLYLLDNNGNLVRFAPDGSTREIVANVYVYEANTSGVKLVFNNDWVYVYELAKHLGLDEEYDEKITRYSLDGKKKEEICSFRAKGAAIQNVQAYENQLFFMIRQGATEEKDNRLVIKEIYHGIYMYQEDTKTAGKVIDKEVIDYCIDSKNNVIYYFENQKGLHRYEVKTEKDEIVYEADESCMMAYLSCDGERVYIDNSQWVSYSSRMPLAEEKEVDTKLIVLDLSGALLGEYKFDNKATIYFGDKDKLFAQILIKNKRSLVYADKASLTGGGEINWQRLE